MKIPFVCIKEDIFVPGTHELLKDTEFTRTFKTLFHIESFLSQQNKSYKYATFGIICLVLDHIQSLDEALAICSLDPHFD